MAPEIPLVLQSCDFEGVNFICSSSTWYIKVHLISLTYSAYGILFFMLQFALIRKGKKKKSLQFASIYHSHLPSQQPFTLEIFELSSVLCVDSGQALCIHLENECQAYQLQSAIFHEALLSCLPLANGAETKFLPYISVKVLLFCLSVLICIAERTLTFSGKSLLNEGTIKKVASHVPLLSRPTERKYRYTLSIH